MADSSPYSKICILGTGEFGRALGARLQRYDVPFCFGSRQPTAIRRGALKEVLDGVAVKTVEECCQSSDVIILAIHPRHYELLSRYGDQLAGKILIDVSNESRSLGEPSADRLAAMIPKSSVIKALNTVSSRAMAIDEDRSVYVCGNDEVAKRLVIRLASRIGFAPADFGKLANGAVLEAKANRLFPGWGWPCLVLVVVSAFWIVFTACREFKLRKDPYSPERLAANVVNKIVGAIAATSLSFVFIPGCLVTFAQLIKGTKHVDLPRIITEWLNMRLQLGLFALLLATIHMILSLALISPVYFPNWYPKIKYSLSVNGTPADASLATRMTWVGEAVILMGTLAIAAMSLIGISTMPSISRTLSRREWRCVQSDMGFVCVLLTVCHLTVKGAPVWMTKGVEDIIPTVTFLSSLLPWLTVGMRLVLYTPFVYRRVAKIRNGELPKPPPLATTHKAQKSRTNETSQELSIVV